MGGVTYPHSCGEILNPCTHLLEKKYKRVGPPSLVEYIIGNSSLPFQPHLGHIPLLS